MNVQRVAVVLKVEVSIVQAPLAQLRRERLFKLCNALHNFGQGRSNLARVLARLAGAGRIAPSVETLRDDPLRARVRDRTQSWLG